MDKNGNSSIYYYYYYYYYYYFPGVAFFLFFFFFSFFFVLTRHDFFLDMIFIFFNNLGDCFFFGCLSLFCFNWLSFFNKSI